MAGRRLGLALVVWVAILGMVGTAAADPRLRRESERRNRIGTQFYNAGKFEQALQMYQGAYDLLPDPRYLFNIALAKEKMFDYEGCVVALQSFLRATAKAPEAHDNAEKRMALCLERVTIPVRFTSVPTNAAVYEITGDKRTLLGRTPQEASLPPGQHSIAVELSGYVTQQRQIEVAVGERPKPDFVLEKLSSIRIEADPSGARISVDGGAWEPAPLERQVKAGTYHVRVKKKGYEPAQRDLIVEPGAAMSLVMPLRPLPTIRKLTVALAGRSRPATHLTVDGRPRGSAPAEIALSPGTHQVRLTAAGRLPYADTIVVSENRDAHLLVDLHPRRSRTNKLALWSLTAATGAALITGSIFGGLTLADQSRFHDNPTDIGLHHRGERRAETADIFFGTTVALAAGTVIYYMLTRPGDSTARLR